MQRSRHVVVTKLPSGIALCSALVAVPALVVGRPGASIVVFAVALVAAVVLLERRAHTAPRRPELPRLGLALVPVPCRARPARTPPQARWELVERDGQRSLSMRWS